MPYQRRNYRKRNYKRNNYRKFNRTVSTAGNVARTAGIALGTAKLAMSLLNPEFKVIDVDQFIQQQTTTPTVVLLNGLIEGTDYDERVGRSIKMKSYEIGFISSAPANCFIRAILVLDTEPAKNQMTLNELLEDATNNPILSPRNLSNRNRFVILKDWQISMVAGSYSQQVIRTKYKQVDYHSIYDDSNSGTALDLKKNALYMIYVSDISTTSPSITHYSRIRFLDN